jgi:hypothetical protein
VIRNCDISVEMMSSARRIVIAALIVCLGAVWTCPAYCATMSIGSHAHDVAPPTAAAMTGHEHHHMSSPANDDSTNDGGAALQSAHRDCCGNCGSTDHALLSAAKPQTSVLKASHLAATMPTSASTRAALLRGPASPARHLPHDEPPSLESTAPLRV